MDGFVKDKNAGKIARTVRVRLIRLDWLVPDFPKSSLVPRVSHLTNPCGERGKMRESGNEVVLRVRKSYQEWYEESLTGISLKV